jgi:hypothetical protein
MDETNYVVSRQRSYGDMQKKKGDANEYHKLLEPPPKPKKTTNFMKNKLVCGPCKKISLYQRLLPLEPRKPKQLVEGEKGSTSEIYMKSK